MPAPPWPLIEIAIEPKSIADQETLGRAFQKLAIDDPTVCISIDLESGQIVLGGSSEAQVDRAVAMLVAEQLILAIGPAQVAYRETLGHRAEIDCTHKKHLGPMSQFARVKIEFEPTEPGAGYAFASKVVAGSVPEEFIPGVEKGLLSAKDRGLFAGFPVIDFEATLVDGAYHEVDSSVRAFEIAAQAAFRELRDKASPRLLEPIMKVEVTTPDDYIGNVIGDLSSRRGHIHSVDQRGDAPSIIATVPLANMFGYANTLRGMTKDRAAFHMDYDRYEALPPPDPPDDRFPSAAAMRA
jgi:elongation factor G